MAKAVQKIILSPSRDIPLDRLILSQANVRRIKAGVTIGELAEDIARRTLLQSLNVRPILDADHQETGMFEVPAGGRRFRALELLVKQKRLAKNAPVPCVVRPAFDEVSAEEDSLAENTFREQLHPLDQFRAMQAMVDKGADVEAIAAHFMTTPAVVRQRLKLASVSPKLHEVYAEDGMTLEQLMAFSVSDDHARQEQVWELLGHSFNKSAGYIRPRLTENSVRVADKRVRFVTLDAYVAAGGGVMRDLFEDDDGGWLTDPALLDTLVADRLDAEADRIRAEGWNWVATAADMPWNAAVGLRELAGTTVAMTCEEEARMQALQAEAEALESEWADAPSLPEEITAKLDALDRELGLLVDRPQTFAPEEVARAGAFVSIASDGSLIIELGYVKPEDEPAAEVEDTTGAERCGGEASGDGMSSGPDEPTMPGGVSEPEAEAEDEVVKPLPDRLVAELTAWRTLALQDALARDPATAFVAVLHAFVLDAFYPASRETCLQMTANRASFAFAPTDLKDSGPARAISERHGQWKARLPQSDRDLWDALLRFDNAEQSALFAHCASLVVNAQAEVVPKYDNGRVSRHSIERRLEHSHVLARTVGLDLVAAGWRPTVTGYFQSVTKPRILADVGDARGSQFAGMIAHLKKPDMAREAERLLEEAAWLPEPMRTPEGCEVFTDGDGIDALPAFLEGPVLPSEEADYAHYAIAAE